MPMQQEEKTLSDPKKRVMKDESFYEKLEIWKAADELWGSIPQLLSLQ